MFKDFDKWNERQKEIEFKSSHKFPKVREIWWCYLGVSIGREEDGKEPTFQRPVLIMKSFNISTCIIVPLTTSPSKSVHRLIISDINGKKNQVILSQIRLLDTKRLSNKIKVIDKKTFESIRKSLKEML